MKLHHFYHVYQSGNWETPVAEHAKALVDSGLADELDNIKLGIVGIDALGPCTVFLDHGIDPLVVANSPYQWEQLTMKAMRRWAVSNDGAVLYAHTKGSYNVSEFNDMWRRSMTYYNVIKWREAVSHLSMADTVGCHWCQDHFWGGTYWWATVKYIKSLPELDMTNRWKAEEWIGERNPRIYDMNPGWPSEGLFTTSW